VLRQLADRPFVGMALDLHFAAATCGHGKASLDRRWRTI
jgi:hypothetical protein